MSPSNPRAGNEVSVTIMGRQYRIACQPEQAESLRSAALHVNTRMTELTNSGGISSVDQVAIFTALNIAHELLDKDQEKISFANEISDELANLRTRIDGALEGSSMKITQG